MEFTDWPRRPGLRISALGDREHGGPPVVLRSCPGSHREDCRCWAGGLVEARVYLDGGVHGRYANGTEDLDQAYPQLVLRWGSDPSSTTVSNALALVTDDDEGTRLRAAVRGLYEQLPAIGRPRGSGQADERRAQYASVIRGLATAGKYPESRISKQLVADTMQERDHAHAAVDLSRMRKDVVARGGWVSFRSAALRGEA